MKILLTGGGSGGHFYPLIAIADEINEVASEKKLLGVELYYMADQPYNEGLLFDKRITFKKTSAGKIRRYFSILNFFDLFKTAFGVITTFFEMFNLYPDVVFGKGGHVSFPALFAAKLLRIPVIIHESDSKPGRVNAWAAKFARKIAVSYPEAAQFFPADKVAHTGNPIRKEVATPLKNGADEFLGLEPGVPVILILGGSQGSAFINETLMDVLPELLEKYQIIHQTGRKNYPEVKRTAEVILANSTHKSRYHAFDYLNDLAMRMSAGASDLVISRAGSTIFEIAAWGKPSIIIPIAPHISHDQTENAFSYARSGACIVMEEPNLTPHILASEVTRLIDHPEIREKMTTAANGFAKLDAARKIAEEILIIALEHEK